MKKCFIQRRQTLYIKGNLLLGVLVMMLLAFQPTLFAGVISGTFTTLTSCPQTLSAMCVDPTTGIMYAVGDQSSNAFYKYTVSSNTWTALANAPVTTGNNAGATYLGGKIYIAYTSKADIQVYTVSSNTWATLTGPTGGVYTGCISNDGTNVYIACSGTLGKFWRYNVSGGTWTELASVPIADKWGGLAYNNGYFYCTQGNGNNGFQKYRVSTDIWTTLTDVPLTGAVLGAAIYDAYYYCMGDYGGTNLYSYDLGDQTWNNTLTLPWTINDATICVYNNALYIIQGEAGTGFTKFTPNNPMLTSIEGTALNYNLGDAAVNVTSTLIASQNAGTNFQSATVTIASGFQTGKDVLSFVNANGITGSWDSGTGVLTLTGTTTIANYQTALRSVKYVNADLTSNNITRMISFKVYDGSIYSNTASRNILIPGPPSVTTAEVTNITATSASCGGTITEDNGANVTARGVCYNTTGNPTISDTKTTDGTGMGTFISSLTGLTLGATYYVKAYATNSNGTNYGAQKTFIPVICTPPTSSSACSNMWITNVTTTGGITNFSNTTACSATSYTNYSSTKSVSQAAGSSVSMSFTSQSYALNYAVWVDFDDDGTFEADEKMISLSNSSLTTSATSFTVPVDATSGSHRMRVMGEYSSNPIPSDPCAALQYGETEDYMLIVGSSAPANPTSISVTNNPICSGTSTQLTANGVDGTVYWYTASCGGTATTPATGNTLTVSPSTTTTYYARNYNNSQFSEGCASITITVNPLLQYRTVQSGNWTTLANWEQYNGVSWIAATSYPGQITNSCSSPLVTIRTAHQMQLSGTDITIPNLKVEGTGKLTIESTGKIFVSGQLQLDANASGAIVVK